MKYTKCGNVMQLSPAHWKANSPTMHYSTSRHYEHRYFYSELQRVEMRIIDAIKKLHRPTKFKILKELKKCNLQAGAIEKGFRWLEKNFVIWHRSEKSTWYEYYLEEGVEHDTN